jgi:hypothetical protein
MNLPKIKVSGPPEGCVVLIWMVRRNVIDLYGQNKKEKMDGRKKRKLNEGHNLISLVYLCNTWVL